jgi:hypothetical protein
LATLLAVAGLKLDLSFTAELGSADATCEHLAKALAGLAEGCGLKAPASRCCVKAKLAPP